MTESRKNEKAFSASTVLASEAIGLFLGAAFQAARAFGEQLGQEESEEALHEFRLMLRRTRTLLKAVSAVFADPAFEKFQEDLKIIFRQTSAARDIDASIERICSSLNASLSQAPEETEDFLLFLKARQREEQTAFHTLTESTAYTSTLARWQQLATAGPRGADNMSFGTFARDALNFFLSRADEAFGKFRETPTAGNLHSYRKRMKDVRYLLEFLAVMLPSPAKIRICADLKVFLKALGKRQDAVVMKSLLEAWLSRPRQENGQDKKALESVFGASGTERRGEVKRLFPWREATCVRAGIHEILASLGNR